MKRALAFLSCPVLLLLSGCFTMGQFVPATPTDWETTVDGSRDVVFESLLSVVQSHNLSVEVLEKQSGFMQFKNATLLPSQMDQYCRYPFVKRNTTQPMRTFVESTKTIRPNSGGSVSLSILLSPLSANSTKLKIHSSWFARFGILTYPCTSLSVLEKEVEADLRSHLVGLVSPRVATTPTPTPAPTPAPPPAQASAPAPARTAARAPAPTPRPRPALAVGTKLFTKDGAPFGTVMLVTSSGAVSVSQVNSGVVTMTREQALAMMQK